MYRLLGCALPIRETPGSIGYLDAGHGRNQAGLGEVSLRNAAGAYVTSSDLAESKGLELVAEYAVKNNVFNADYTDDWSAVALLNLCTTCARLRLACVRLRFAHACLC